MNTFISVRGNINVQERRDWDYIPNVTGWVEVDERAFCLFLLEYNYFRTLCGQAIGYKLQSTGRIVALEFVKHRGALFGYKFYINP